MMVSSHLFQDFGTMKAAKVGKRSMSAEELEELKLQAFESGYQAGWDDAVKAQVASVTHVSSEFGNNLQAASFEYHEMRATLNASVQSIMNEVVTVILPVVARESLGVHIRDCITSVVQDSLDRPILITVAPASEEAVRATLTSDLPEPFEFYPDSTMSPNQVILRLGASEKEVNLDKTVADIESAVTSFFEIQNPEVTNG
ncbi:hypothetical protein [Tateyamaria sp.]|uniref:FliH/SctL family protein n=1 Tax=Tateyamaria sp. TaxID=1929288 RepID=UPI00329C8F89